MAFFKWWSLENTVLHVSSQFLQCDTLKPSRFFARRFSVWKNVQVVKNAIRQRWLALNGVFQLVVTRNTVLHVSTQFLQCDTLKPSRFFACRFSVWKNVWVVKNAIRRRWLALNDIFQLVVTRNTVLHVSTQFLQCDTLKPSRFFARRFSEWKKV